MKVTGPPPSAVQNRSGVRRSARGTFDIPTADQANGPESATALAPVDEAISEGAGGALKGERSRRFAHGDRILKALEQLHLCYLDGVVDADTARNLRAALKAGGVSGDDPEMEALLNSIEQRLVVEVQKLRTEAN